MNKVLIVFILFFLATSANAQNINFDKKLAKKMNETVVTEQGLYNNDRMNAYLDSIGQRLVSQLDNKLFDYKFHLVYDESPNAFALPDGYVYVTSGMIPLLENEDELACIMGHEIIHSNNRHSIKKLERKIPFIVLEIPGLLVGMLDKVAGDVIEGPAKITDAYVSASYSRKLETEADDLGIILATKAGYDPNALPIVLTRMIKSIEEMTGYKEKKSFLDDHPYTPDRNKNIMKHLENVTVNKTAHISNQFLNEFEGVIYGKSVSKGIIRKNKFLQPDMDFYIEFPENWVINNLPSYIIAHDTIKKSALKLSIEDPKISPKQAGENYLKTLSKSYRNTLTENKEFEQNGEKGYVIRFTENTSEGILNAFVIWMPLNGNIYKYTGISYKENHIIIENVTKTLRVLTEDEKKSIMQKQISIVEANGNENISELSKITSNLISPKLTATINDIKPKEKINKGTKIKIVVEKPYFN